MSQIITANTSNPSSDDADNDWEMIPTANTSLKPVLEFLNINGDWKDSGDCLMFKATLPGTKMEDLKIETDIYGKFLKITRELSAMFEGESVKEVLKECCCSGDSDIGKISRSFNLPEGVTVKPNEFNAWVDKDGVLNVTFTKLKRSKKKMMSKVLGALAKAVPVVFVVVSLVDEISGDN